MNTTRRRLVYGLRGSIWGPGGQHAVAGMFGTGHGQASIAPREGCG